MNLLNEQQMNLDTQEKADEEILACSVSDPDIFSILLDRYQDAFTRKAMTVVRSREDAEDIVQETFSKIYIYADRFQVRDGASFSSWAYRILLNTAFTRYQKLKKVKAATKNMDPEVYERLPDTQSEQFEKMEMSDYVVSILSEIPEQFQRILEMYFIEGKPQKEIAEIEGISVGAVKTRVHRAKDSFRKKMSGKLSI